MRSFLFGIALAILFVPSASAQEFQPAPETEGVARMSPDGFGIGMGFGYSRVGGEWGEALEYALDADINLSYLFPSGIRIGVGAYYASYHVQPQFGAEKVSNVQLQALLGYGFPLGKWRPYGQLRATYVRLRLEGHHGSGPAPPEGENTEPRQHGLGGVALGGLEYIVSRYVTLDANAWFGMFSTQDMNLSDISAPDVSQGRSWGVRLGIVWYTDP